MKASNIGLILSGLVMAWVIWILFDMAVPPSTGGSSASMAAVHSSPVPVLVEFYADWCGPCKVVGPVVEELAAEVAASGRARVVRMDVDQHPQLARELGIRGIPAFIVYKNGQETTRQTGTIPKALMKEMLGL